MTKKLFSWLQRAFFFVFVSLLFVGVSTTLAFADVVDTDVSKAIAVAFDNSGSMSESSDRWCTAKYSLEILAAMMGTDDTLIIEPMRTVDGNNNGYEVYGSQVASERVDKVHGTDLGTAYETDPQTASVALDKLLSVSADEHYLVITTDGKFMSKDGVAGIDIIRQTVARCKQSNPPVKVLYLAIGEDADAIDEDKNVFVERAGEGEKVLESMKNIANIIFGRARLDGAYYNAKKGTMSLDTPMSSLIVLAQGKGAQVSSITWADGEVRPDTAEVKYCDHPYEITKQLQANELYQKADYEEKYYNHAKVNKNLIGAAGVYTDQLAAGDYKLNAKGSAIEVYYKPYVDVAVVLQSESGATFNLSDAQQTTAIPHGDYVVTYRLRDPDTKKTLVSRLLDGGDFNLRVDDGGSTETYGEGDVITLDPGTPTLVATVELPSHVRVTHKFKDVKVAADSQPLDIDLTGLPSSYDVESYDKDESTGTVRISKQSGEEITPDEWDRMVVEVTSKDGPAWSVEKTEETGVLSVKPSYESGSAADEEQRLLSVPLPLLEKWLRIPSEEYPTAVTAFVPDDIRPYAGGEKTVVKVRCHWAHSYLRWAIAALIFAVVMWLLWFVLTWPKLPKHLDPCLELGRTGDILEFESNLKPKKALVHDRGRLLPRRTQLMSFGPGFMRTADALPEAITGAAFEVEALPHGFRLTMDAREGVKSLAQSHGFEWENLDAKSYIKASVLTCERDAAHTGTSFMLSDTYIVHFVNPNLQ